MRFPVTLHKCRTFVLSYMLFYLLNVFILIVFDAVSRCSHIYMCPIVHTYHASNIEVSSE